MQVVNPPGAASNLLNDSGNMLEYFLGVTSVAANASTLSQVRAYRVVIGANKTLAAVINNLIVTATGKVAVALYDSDPVTGRPGNRVYQFDELDLNIAGVNTTAGIAVAAGSYWVVYHNFTSQTAGGGRFASLTAGTSPLVNAAGVVVNRLDATKVYAYPQPAVSDYVWTDSAAVIVTPIGFKVS